MNKNSEILFTKLKTLLKEGGFVVFAIDPYYVQFAKDDGEDQIDFEAVSHYCIKSVSNELMQDFLKLGFKIDNLNYYKKITSNTLDNIIYEVQQIFEDIYKVDYEKPFDVRDSFTN